jgi:hypothetical protein
MLTLTLGLNFFGLSSDYRKYMDDEFFALSRTINLTYTDYYKLPTYSRRYFINKLIEEQEQRDKN